MTKVYVVETGVYADRTIVGVYSSPELAMVTHPIPAKPHYPKARADDGALVGRWVQYSDGDWWNSLDFDECVGITSFEIDANVPATHGGATVS